MLVGPKNPTKGPQSTMLHVGYLHQAVLGPQACSGCW